jgi:hypothetical protein
LFLFDLTLGRVSRVIEEKGGNIVSSVKFSRDGQLLATCGDIQGMGVYRVSTGALVAEDRGYTCRGLDFGPGNVWRQ